ncbi:hypothetical protein PY257_15445 [Ramlibacter sp. H39-3-26]|uniref:hypothetical protein n=1 Tax=Curvibacter soli TaxID=3031331 RepID=UPI0023DC0DCF|nr:hypothetical protein [Ramlibacter sp. H39-3-26]MDF1486557.1 hypothetical protein [Ramlibacter sp. H39-3-26]
MAHDYAVFRKNAQAGGTLAQLDATIARYRAGYANRFRDWLRSHNRCISWMITGPTKFPRHKWNQAAHKRMTELVKYREQVLRATWCANCARTCGPVCRAIPMPAGMSLWRPWCRRCCRVRGTMMAITAMPFRPRFRQQPTRTICVARRRSVSIPPARH